MKRYSYDEKKTVIALASRLEPGVALNVTGHLCLSLGAYGGEDLMGRKTLLDQSGMEHIGISRYPVVITRVKQGRLRKLLDDCRAEPELLVIDYPQQMLDTGHDDELAEALLQVAEYELQYLGVLVYGDSSKVSELTGQFMLWN